MPWRPSDIISIHAPTRGATNNRQPGIRRLFRFQSTLPREERRKKEITDLKNFTISIHAPTRGATNYRHTHGQGHRYFNPRSHERSDNLVPGKEYTVRDFNPRSHERSDSNIAQKICLFLYNTDNKYIIR